MMMPIASLGRGRTGIQEVIIKIGLVSLAGAMLACCGILLWGLRGADVSSDALDRGQS